MEDMKDELDFEGLDVQFVIVNQAGSIAQQANLTNNTTFPVFQDTFDMDAWEMHDGKKDDIYIYDENGVLTHYFTLGGALSLNLSTTEGYENVKNAILDTLP